MAKVTCTDDVMSGDPCIDGTRVPAETIVANLRRIYEAYPTLPEGSVEAAIELARETQGPDWWRTEKRRQYDALGEVFDERAAHERKGGAAMPADGTSPGLSIDDPMWNASWEDHLLAFPGGDETTLPRMDRRDIVEPCVQDEKKEMSERGMRSAAESLLADLDEHDRNRPERNSVEDRTSAEVMRRNRATEEVVRVFGYSPEPIRPSART
jgi:uncharacterized protein (DUF433 family)